MIYPSRANEYDYCVMKLSRSSIMNITKLGRSRNMAKITTVCRSQTRKGINRKFSFVLVWGCVCRSPQTPSSVSKLEGWNFKYRLLILMPKSYQQDFWNFVAGLRYWGFSELGWARWRQRTLDWASYMQNFCPLASKLREETEVTPQYENLQYSQKICRAHCGYASFT